MPILRRSGRGRRVIDHRLKKAITACAGAIACFIAPFPNTHRPKSAVLGFRSRRRQDDLAASERARVPESKSASYDDYDDSIAFGSERAALPVVYASARQLDIVEIMY